MEVNGQLYTPPPSACSERKNPGAHWTGGWVGPITRLDVSEMTCKNFPFPEPGSFEAAAYSPYRLLYSTSLHKHAIKDKHIYIYIVLAGKSTDLASK